MNSMQWRLRLEIGSVRFGLWWLPGLLALAVVGWMWLIWLPGQDRQLQAVLDQVAQVSRSANAVSKQVKPSGVDLPAMDAASTTLQQLFDLANRDNLLIAQADYRRIEAGRLGRLQVQMPVQGAYPQVRHFLRTVREQLPGVSLDEIGIRRGDGGVEAKMLFSIWYASAELSHQSVPSKEAP